MNERRDLRQAPRKRRSFAALVVDVAMLLDSPDRARATTVGDFAAELDEHPQRVADALEVLIAVDDLEQTFGLPVGVSTRMRARNVRSLVVEVRGF